MRVDVNYDRCEGHAVCVGLAPGVFAINDDDEQVRVINDAPSESEQSDVVLASRRCPTLAITITE